MTFTSSRAVIYFEVFFDYLAQNAWQNEKKNGDQLLSWTGCLCGLHYQTTAPNSIWTDSDSNDLVLFLLRSSLNFLSHKTVDLGHCLQYVNSLPVFFFYKKSYFQKFRCSAAKKKKIWRFSLKHLLAQSCTRSHLGVLRKKIAKLEIIRSGNLAE